MAAQFTIWDKIRLTADMKETQLTNLAKFISHLIRYLDPVLRIRIRDPLSFLPLDPGQKKSGSVINRTSQIIFPRAQKPFLGLKILKFFDADSDPGSRMEKFGSGINILDPQHCLDLSYSRRAVEDSVGNQTFSRLTQDWDFQRQFQSRPFLCNA